MQLIIVDVIKFRSVFVIYVEVAIAACPLSQVIS